VNGKKIWVVQTGEPFSFDNSGRVMRGQLVADYFKARGAFVSVFTSRFFHQKRALRNATAQFNHEGIDFYLLDSCGYGSSISIKRIVDHFQLAINFIVTVLRFKISKPNFIFLGYPPVELAFVVSLYAKARRIPIILDVKDQWPIIFERGLGFLPRPIVRILITPFHWMAKFCLREASLVTTISCSFKDWVLGYSNRSDCERFLVLPLCAPRKNFSADQVSKTHLNSLVYFGSFTEVYDFSAFACAFKKVLKIYPDLRFVFGGTGPKLDQVLELFSEIPNSEYVGYLDQDGVAAHYSSAIASIAPFRALSDFRLAIPNKIGESINYRVPVLSALKGEVELLLQGGGGVAVFSDTPECWEKALHRAIKNRDALVANIERVIDRFDFEANMQHLNERMS